MEAQNIFFTVGTIALILFSAFIVFFFYALYRLIKIAKSGLSTLSFTARDLQGSIASLAKGWGGVTIAGMALRLLRMFILRR